MFGRPERVWVIHQIEICVAIFGLVSRGLRQCPLELLLWAGPPPASQHVQKGNRYGFGGIRSIFTAYNQTVFEAFHTIKRFGALLNISTDSFTSAHEQHLSGRAVDLKGQLG